MENLYGHVLLMSITNYFLNNLFIITGNAKQRKAQVTLSDGKNKFLQYSNIEALPCTKGAL
jgi:hypothetical protein